MPVASEETTLVHRQIAQQLTEDLGWLEQHAREREITPQLGGRLRLAAALVRNCIGPFLEDDSAEPLHIAVVGGAGAGKSTITNFLVGATAAESNPQAGFTRHPIAYTSANGTLPWAQRIGFLSRLRRLWEPQPSNLDEDVYQVRRISSGDQIAGLLNRFVVWDCPDMTTWAATGYATRLIEIIGLADVVVYVASDERYNDEVPTQYLQLVLQAGKPVVACILKMKPEQAETIVDHFRREVIARIPDCTHVSATLAVPHLTPAELTDPIGNAGRFRQPLLDAVAWYGSRGGETRLAAVRGAVDFLNEQQDVLLSAAKADVAALSTWRELVDSGTAEFQSRYQKEYLSGEKFPRFDEALVRLLQLLELPGVGQYLSKALWIVRTPWRLLKGMFGKITGRSQTPAVPEEPVMATGMNGLLDVLRMEAARRKETHPLWAHVDKGFQGALPAQAREQFQHCVREFHAAQIQEVDATARAIYQDLEKNPIALNTLRSGKFALEAASIVGTIIAGGINWMDIFLVPLVASLTQELIELLGKQYVDIQRESARQRQLELFQRTMSRPLSDWLGEWPATGGSTFEQLQRALRRIPDEIQTLTRIVHRRLEDRMRNP
jgi:hypothetical protein